MKGNHESQHDNRALKDSDLEPIHRKKERRPSARASLAGKSEMYISHAMGAKMRPEFFFRWSKVAA